MSRSSDCACITRSGSHGLGFIFWLLIPSSKAVKLTSLFGNLGDMFSLRIRNWAQVSNKSQSVSKFGKSIYRNYIEEHSRACKTFFNSIRADLTFWFKMLIQIFPTPIAWKEPWSAVLIGWGLLNWVYLEKIDLKGVRWTEAPESRIHSWVFSIARFGETAIFAEISDIYYLQLFG
jgi:hypothetical protein